MRRCTRGSARKEGQLLNLHGSRALTLVALERQGDQACGAAMAARARRSDCQALEARPAPTLAAPARARLRVATGPPLFGAVSLRQSHRRLDAGWIEVELGGQARGAAVVGRARRGGC